MDTTTASSLIKNIRNEVNKGFLGKTEQVELAVTSICAGLNILIEHRPGVGNTTLANGIGRALGLNFGRIQFTPDMLPGDITGMTVWDDKKREFSFHKGPVFHQAVLADELNRASARTQSALLEAMEEGTVTIDGTTHELPKPFMVIATQNPSQFSGTFTLPESQLDRFGVSFSLGYAEPEYEGAILTEYRDTNPMDRIGQATETEELLDLMAFIRSISIDDKVRDYLVALANKSRSSKMISTGFTTRGIQHVLSLAQTYAVYQGRDFVIPEDIHWAALPAARHKFILSPEMKIENRSVEYVTKRLLDGVATPV